MQGVRAGLPVNCFDAKRVVAALIFFEETDTWGKGTQAATIHAFSHWNLISFSRDLDPLCGGGTAASLT